MELISDTEIKQPHPIARMLELAQSLLIAYFLPAISKGTSPHTSLGLFLWSSPGLCSVLSFQTLLVSKTPPRQLLPSGAVCLQLCRADAGSLKLSSENIFITSSCLGFLVPSSLALWLHRARGSVILPSELVLKVLFVWRAWPPRRARHAMSLPSHSPGCWWEVVLMHLQGWQAEPPFLHVAATVRAMKYNWCEVNLLGLFLPLLRLIMYPDSLGGNAF